MQRTSVIRHRKDTAIDKKKIESNARKKREREERVWVMRLHYVFVFSWDKWVSEIEQSPRPKQIKHKSSSRRYAANTVTRLWGEHGFFERTERGRFVMNLNRKMLYLSGITWAMQPKATWVTLFQSDHISAGHISSFYYICHHSVVCNYNALYFLEYIHLISMQNQIHYQTVPPRYMSRKAWYLQWHHI